MVYNIRSINFGNLLYHRGEISLHPFERIGKHATIPSAEFERLSKANPRAFQAYYSHSELTDPEGRVHHQLDITRFASGSEGPKKSEEGPARAESIFPLLKAAVSKIAAHHLPEGEKFGTINIDSSSLFFHPTAYNQLLSLSGRLGYDVVAGSGAGAHGQAPKQPASPKEYFDILHNDFAKLEESGRGEEIKERFAEHPEFKTTLGALQKAFDSGDPLVLRRAVSMANRKGWNPMLERIFPSMYVSYQLRRKEGV